MSKSNEGVLVFGMWVAEVAQIFAVECARVGVRVTVGASTGTLLSWVLSGHFAVWEHASGFSLGQIGAMAGFLAGILRPDLNLPRST